MQRGITYSWWTCVASKQLCSKSRLIRTRMSITLETMPSASRPQFMSLLTVEELSSHIKRETFGFLWSCQQVQGGPSSWWWSTLLPSRKWRRWWKRSLMGSCLPLECGFLLKEEIISHLTTFPRRYPCLLSCLATWPLVIQSDCRNVHSLWIWSWILPLQLKLQFVVISGQFANRSMAAAMDQAQEVAGGAQVQVMPPQRRVSKFFL